MNREVFLVDDDEDLNEIIAWAMRNEGFDVRCFLSGEEAINGVNSNCPEVVVLDYNLGDMTGREFVKGLTSRPKIIFISGSPEEVWENVPSEYFHLVIEKPLDLERLLRELNEIYLPKALNEASMLSSHGSASFE